MGSYFKLRMGILYDHLSPKERRVIDFFVGIVGLAEISCLKGGLVVPVPH